MSEKIPSRTITVTSRRPYEGPAAAIADAMRRTTIDEQLKWAGNVVITIDATFFEAGAMIHDIRIGKPPT